MYSDKARQREAVRKAQRKHRAKQKDIMLNNVEYTPRCGFVYIIRCVGFPYYKIGQATNVKSRLAMLQTGVPFELIIEYANAVKDMNEAEIKIHDKYKDKCVRGEWFILTDVELNAVKTDIVSLKDYVYKQQHQGAIL